MWLSKITYDLEAVRKNIDLFELEVSQPIREKRMDLQSGKGDREGEMVWEFHFHWEEVLNSDDRFLTSVRRWETQSVAQELADFAVSKANYITAVVEEEQV